MLVLVNFVYSWYVQIVGEVFGSAFLYSIIEWRPSALKAMSSREYRMCETPHLGTEEANVFLRYCCICTTYFVWYGVECASKAAIGNILPMHVPCALFMYHDKRSRLDEESGRGPWYVRSRSLKTLLRPYSTLVTSGTTQVRQCLPNMFIYLPLDLYGPCYK